jgi:hypothetical protein
MGRTYKYMNRISKWNLKNAGCKDVKWIELAKEKV